MTNFGASFKKARESKGISLDQIAKETRISTRFLAAIEDEEFELLPGGIFNRGFVRTFAEKVGLEPDQAVADYERLVSVRVEPVDPGATENAQPSKNERRLYPIALGILAIAIAIFYVVTRDSGRSGDSSITAPASSPAPVQQEPATPPPVPEAPPETTQAANTPPPQPQPEPAPVAPPPVAQAITLDIQAVEPTWIKVSSDGTSVVAGEILEPGTTRKFTAQTSLYLSVGNAAGLTMKINDIPVKPLGKSGQVRSVTFTPANLKDFIG